MLKPTQPPHSLLEIWMTMSSTSAPIGSLFPALPVLPVFWTFPKVLPVCIEVLYTMTSYQVHQISVTSRWRHALSGFLHECYTQMKHHLSTVLPKNTKIKNRAKIIVALGLMSFQSSQTYPVPHATSRMSVQPLLFSSSTIHWRYWLVRLCRQPI